MYEYEAGGDGSLILDENGSVVATVTVEADAREIVAALNLVNRAVEEFPGLVNGEEGVNGGDLVDLFGDCLEFDAEGRYREKVQAFRCRAGGKVWGAAELDHAPDVIGPFCPNGECGSGDLVPYEEEPGTP